MADPTTTAARHLRRECECGHRHPMFRCRHYQFSHAPHYWPARASETTFYCDGGGDQREVPPTT